MSLGEDTNTVKLPPLVKPTKTEVESSKPEVNQPPNEEKETFQRSNNRRYQILETQGFVVGKSLGQGSYATVKSAYDINRKQKVAIKIISKKKAPDDYLTKFLPREIEIVRILQHPSLIAFYQVIETTSRFFLVMECADKGDLLESIRALKYVPEDQAGVWFRSLHDGILYMHDHGIVHRDLKCENLLVDSANNLRITDFGFARRNLRGKIGEVVYSETYCGSYAYAPPEILKGIPYNPFLSEIWSMGVILYTMVYGRLPFDDSDHKTLLRQTQSRVIFPAKPDISEECRIMILKMLIKGQERVPIHNLIYDNWFKKKCRVADDDNVSRSELSKPVEVEQTAKDGSDTPRTEAPESSDPNSEKEKKSGELPSIKTRQ